MQRWIMVAAIVIALGGIGLMGGYVWLKNDRANRPDRIWVPITLNAKLTHEQHVEFADTMREQLVTDDRFNAIVTDLGLQQRWSLPSAQECVDELKRRVICEVGEHQYAPSLNIGFRGTRRENAMLRELTERLMQDVDEIIRASAPPDNS